MAKATRCQAEQPWLKNVFTLNQYVYLGATMPLSFPPVSQTRTAWLDEKARKPDRAWPALQLAACSHQICKADCFSLLHPCIPVSAEGAAEPYGNAQTSSTEQVNRRSSRLC